MKRYDGTIAVVVGASSGLGRRLALDLVRRGATVVAIARRADLLETLAKEGGDALSVRVADVADAEALQATLGDVEVERGRIDVLVCAAAFEQPTRIEDNDLDLYRRTLDVNVLGTVAANLAVLAGMQRRGSGVVVNISSDHGRAPAAGTPAYSASKAAVSAFTESMAHEVAGSGVHVHVLYPGWVPTALGQGAVDNGMPMPPRIVRRTEEQISELTLERMGGPAIEINGARVAALAPVVRALAPPLYRSQMRKQSIRP